MNNLSFFLLLPLFLAIYYTFRKIGFLNENISYSVHKNFGATNKSPLIIGGIYLIIVVSLYFVKDLIILKLSLIFIYFLGLMSDKNILSSPKIRIILQILILFFLVFFSNLTIDNLENNFLNNLLDNKIINLCFTIFCFAILVNGSNFLDGLNGLLSGYYLMIICSIFYICANNDSILFFHKEEIQIIFLSLLIFFIFNIFGKVYLGDGGSYLIATFIGFYLIEFVSGNLHIYISPYYIAALLWYPAFENLFSISRRILRKNNVSEPDKQHLHQMIFLYLKSKKFFKIKFLNTFSSMIIILLNLPIFILSSLMATHSQKLALLIIVNIFLYILLYNFISKNLKIEK